jgi:hypothetical protein
MDDASGQCHTRLISTLDACHGIHEKNRLA